MFHGFMFKEDLKSNRYMPVLDIMISHLHLCHVQFQQVY